MESKTSDAFERLSDILDTLRKECPWDKVQTMKSLRYLTIEDVHELSEAVVAQSADDIKKELDYTPYFKQGDQVMVRFAQIDSTAYAFWRSFEDMLSLSRIPLFPATVNMPKALPNAYGFWQGWNATYLSVKIPKSVDESFTISR